MADTPVGYHREWVPDDHWRFGSQRTKCRQPKCPNPPVAELDRRVFYWGTMREGKRAYAYCADHLYGRRIENGMVLVSRLVPDEGETS